MDTQKIIRAWTDPQYRESLTPEEKQKLPEHPSSFVDLTDSELAGVAGAGTNCAASAGCCPFVSWTCGSGDPVATCADTCGTTGD